MTHNATQGIETKSPINISNIDKNINDYDLVYIDNRSLKILLPDKENIYETQKSLRQQLQESLNHAGRKSLAKRSVKKPITYKTLRFLISQINNPRTTRTLLDNINKPFSYSIKDLPDFVRQDMKNKRMIQLPKNIHTLHCLASLFPPETYPLSLMKHITTQCLEIDFDSPFDTLEEERLECMLMLFNSFSNIEDLKIITNCIATLSGLESILKLQNKKNWEQITLQPATQPCSNHLLEKYLVDHPHESELLPIDTKIDDTQTDLLISRQKTIKQPTHEPTIINPCESENLDPESPIAEEDLEKALEEAPTSLPDKPQSKDALQKSPNPALTKQTSSKSSQEAIHRNISEILANPNQQEINIENRQTFHCLISFYARRLETNYKARKNVIKAFIEQAKSGNQALCQDAEDAFNSGFWMADQLSDLLTKASLVSTKTFFKERLSQLTKKGYLTIGCPPHNEERQKTYMENNNTMGNKPHKISLHYTLAQGTTPSEALDSCYHDFWIADQGTIIEFIYALTLHFFWGKRIFDSYFVENPFALTSFSEANTCHNPICALMKNLDNLRIYTLGIMYPFHNHSKYPMKHPLGEYQFLYTICTNDTPVTFTSVGFFDVQKIDVVHDTLVSLYNKEALSKEITEDKQSQEPLKECDPEENYPLSISKKILLEKNTSKEVRIVHTINYGKVLEIKQKYNLNFRKAEKNEKIQQERQPEPEPEPQTYKKTKKKRSHTTKYPDYSDSPIDNSTAEAAQATVPPFLRSEAPKTEKILENDQKKILTTLISSVNKTLKACRAGTEKNAKLYEVFLPFKDFYLKLKESNVSLYDDYNGLYIKLRDSVQRYQE